MTIKTMKARVEKLERDGVIVKPKTALKPARKAIKIQGVKNMASQWKAYTGSDEQYREMSRAKSGIMAQMDNGKIEPLMWLSPTTLDHIEQYMICDQTYAGYPQRQVIAKEKKK